MVVFGLCPLTGRAQTPPAVPAPAKPAAPAAPAPAAPAAPMPAAAPAQAPAKPAAPAAPPPATPQPQVISQPEFRNGAEYGRILDIDGKPVSGATVALQERDGKVIAWTTTNAQGEYALAADPMTALHLRASRRRGLLETCCRAVGDVAMAPVKIVASTVTRPGDTVKSAALSVATGTPAPLAGQAAIAALPGRGTADDTGKKARAAAAKAALGESPDPKGKQPPAEKGEALLLVSAPNYKPAKVKAGAYWLEGPCVEKDKPIGMQAWLETVKLAPMAGDKKSDIVHEALTLSDVSAEPPLVPAGGDVKIRVKLNSPPGPEHKVRVFAREASKDTAIELKPQEGADKTIYCGTLTLDPKTPAGETTVRIAALRAEPVEVKLDPKKADPLPEFVRRLDDMQATKPYEYDPRIMASENNVDFKLTVLDVKKGTPSQAPAPAAPAGTAPPPPAPAPAKPAPPAPAAPAAGK